MFEHFLFMKKMTYYYAATRSLSRLAERERERGAHVILPWYKSPVWAGGGLEGGREGEVRGHGTRALITAASMMIWAEQVASGIIQIGRGKWRGRRRGDLSRGRR